ncbi:IS1 family transposase [Dyadobacter sp. NIV53]|uniref:IS1 family transposase n=1 Tax=Dyadobacter sp. NIV53 TaxID=2861765 RepID=UPI001C88DE30
MVRYGRSAQNKQRYYCKHCKSTRVENYSYTAQQPEINPNIISLTKEGCGIRSTARLLRISTITVTSRIKKIASKLVQPTISIGQTYEVDELRTFVRKKDNLIWVVSAFERESGKIVSSKVGRRTNKTLKVVIDTLINPDCKAIYTDKLKNYKSLIDKTIHRTKLRGTNHIERAHLTLRTHRVTDRSSVSTVKQLLLARAQSCSTQF